MMMMMMMMMMIKVLKVRRAVPFLIADWFYLFVNTWTPKLNSNALKLGHNGLLSHQIMLVIANFRLNTSQSYFFCLKWYLKRLILAI